MSTTQDDLNPYEQLGVGLEATEAEIKTAYRQRSLKVHPDRVRPLLFMLPSRILGIHLLPKLHL